MKVKDDFMLRSVDGLLTIEASKTKSDLIIPASDVSVVDVPESPSESEKLFKAIYNVPTDRHVCLVLVRHSKGEYLKALGNVTKIKHLDYMDEVHITYQKSSKRAGSFTHLGESGFLFYKGSQPVVENTNWFRNDINGLNASNHWDLGVYSVSDDKLKEKGDRTIFPKFAWELGLLLMTLATPLQHKRIVWTLPWDENLLQFASEWKIRLHLVTTSDVDAYDALTAYEKIVNKEEKKINKTESLS
jgi:hypothetical protein